MSHLLPFHPKQVPPLDLPIGPIWNDVTRQSAQKPAMKARQEYIHTPLPKSDRYLWSSTLRTRLTVFSIGSWTMCHSSSCTHRTWSSLRRIFTACSISMPPPGRLHEFADYSIYHAANNTNATSSDAIHKLKCNSTKSNIFQNANSMTANKDTPLAPPQPWFLGT